MIAQIGRKYLKSNIENDEFSYKKALKAIGKKIEDYQEDGWRRKYKGIDLRFDNGRLSILIEAKANFDDDLPAAFEQINAYIFNY